MNIIEDFNYEFMGDQLYLHPDLGQLYKKTAIDETIIKESNIKKLISCFRRFIERFRNGV